MENNILFDVANVISSSSIKRTGENDRFSNNNLKNVDSKNNQNDEDPLDAYMNSLIEPGSKEQSLHNGQKTIENDIVDNDPSLSSEDDNQKVSTSNDHHHKSFRDQINSIETAEELLAFTIQRSKTKELGFINHEKESYLSFKKSFYKEVSSISEMTEDEVKEHRKSMDGIKVRGRKCPRPIKSWTQCGLDPRILVTIKSCEYEKPTPIQAQSIPAIMSGRDVIGIAKTGSGKTIAFLLPMFRHIMDQAALRTGDGPIGLVMSPTRELAIQTYFECRKFATSLNLKIVCACGGAPIKDQIADLKRGAEILIATPGRLLELLTTNSGKVTNLKRVTYLVLDEADRMFDMGFEPQVLMIVANIQPKKQAVMFSATFPRQMEGLARKLLVKPIEIIVGAKSTVAKEVTQHVEVISEDDKFIRLLEILGNWYPKKADKILIFVNKQEIADTLYRDVYRRGYVCWSLHGGMEQVERDTAISDFRSGVVPVLIATSVAARGLDVKGLNLVINYECPNHMEDYVHRVGRTGRAGNKGTSYTFITLEQAQYAPEIMKALVASHAHIPSKLKELVENYGDLIKSGSARVIGSGFGGKGLDRIDEERKKVRLNQKKIVLGDEESASSDEAEQQQEILDFETGQIKRIRTMKKASKAQIIPAARVCVSSNINLSIPKEARSKIAELNTKIGQQQTLCNSTEGDFQSSSSSGIVTDKSIGNTNFTNPTGGAMGNRNKIVGATISGEIYPLYEKAPLPGQEYIEPRGYMCEVDINDFPQAVRLKMTNKEMTSQLSEAAGANIIIRGEYIPPGKSSSTGQRRLHVRIDGISKSAVHYAKAEVTRLLKEITLEASDRGSLDFGRFDV